MGHEPSRGPQRPVPFAAAARVVAGLAVLAGSVAAQAGPFGAAVKVHGPRLVPASAAVTDVDLDGRRDLVTGNGLSLDVGRGPMTACLLDAAFRIRRAEALGPTAEPGLVAHPAILAADLTGDGLDDLVAVSDKGAVSIHVHRGSTQDLRAAPRFDVPGGFRYVRLRPRVARAFLQFRTAGLLTGDFDGDRNLDVVLAGDAWFLTGPVATSGMTVLFGDGRGGFRTATVLYPYRLLALVQGDVDADGDADLVGLGPGSVLVVAVQRGGGAFRTARYFLARPDRPDRLAAGDVNGDGRADFLVAGGPRHDAVALYLAGPGGGPTGDPRTPVAAGDLRGIEAMVLGDVDGDGRTDLAVLAVPAGSRARVAIFAGAGDATFTGRGSVRLGTRWDRGALPAFPNLLTAADFDGDQNPELVVASGPDLAAGGLAEWILPNRTPRRWGTRGYGAATPGAGGFVPAISATGGSPSPGNSRFGVLLADAAGGGARAALALSTRLERRQQAGLTLHVFPFHVFGTRTTGRGPGAGNARIPLPVPPAPGLAGRRLYFQWVVADPGAANPLGLAASGVLEVRLGPLLRGR